MRNMCLLQPRCSQWQFVVAIFLMGVFSPPASGETVTLRGGAVGTVTVNPISLADLLVEVNYHGTGVLRNIGHVTTDFTTPEATIDPFARQIEALTPSWNVVLVTANGDEIQGTYTFTDPVISYSRLGFFQIDVTVEVTGGTGRFEGAQGSATVRAYANVYLGVFVLDINGTVTTGNEDT
jgi:hypothetical protein